MPVDACPDIPSRGIVDLKMTTLNSPPRIYVYAAVWTACEAFEALGDFDLQQKIKRNFVRLKGRSPERTKRVVPVPLHSRRPSDHYVHYENTRAWIRRPARSEWNAVRPCFGNQVFDGYSHLGI